MISNDMRLTRVNFKLEIWTRLSGDLHDSKGGRSIQSSGLGAVLRVTKHSSWSDHHKPARDRHLACLWPQGGRSYSQPWAREEKDRDCALQIDNAKDMTLPICSSHLTYSSKLSRL